jgi:hypothetical protein
MTTIAAVNQPSIRHTEFVKLTLGKNTPVIVAVCNAATAITVDGTQFIPAAGLLTIGQVQRDIKATSDDLALGLTGLDTNFISVVLGMDVKGGIVELWRGFLDSNNQIITTPTLQFFKRYQGIINSVSISEDYDDRRRMRTATVTLATNSMRQILESRLSSVKTNQNSWQFLYPGDTSMNRVITIASTYFDFGVPPQSGGISSGTPTKPLPNINNSGNFY